MARNEKEESIHIGFREAITLIVPYFQKKLWLQTKSVVWVVLYLTLFQLIILRIPIKEAGTISIGIFAIILGLTFFMEGLYLGIMPLGESIGLRLPRKVGLFSIILFCLFVGIVATLAEPAIAVLKQCGSTVSPWEAPLLYHLLNEGADVLFFSIAFGVGVSIVLGVLRIIYGVSLSKFLIPSLVVLLCITVYSFFDENLRLVSGLAWDSGVVATGSLTVPLIVALGIGVSKSAQSSDSTTGFGVVTLASLFPIFSVFFVGIYFSSVVPNPMPKEVFLKGGISAQEHKLMFGEKEINFQNGDLNREQTSQLSIHSKISKILEGMGEGFTNSLQAILPLAGCLLIFLYFILKESVPFADELYLGIVFVLIGLSIFNFGIFFGLSKLGSQVGNKLPSSFRSIELTDSIREIQGFNPSIVVKATDEVGTTEEFFYLKEKKSFSQIPYREKNYHPESKLYQYVPIHGPLFGKEENLLGYFVVLVFAFVLGYSATLAEPALSALGNSVEEVTVGTVKKTILIQAVGIGVGIGTLLGILKILISIPLLYILLPSYLVLILLTLVSKPEFIDIAWDSAGVTTGPITVPLVIVLGLGIGNQLNIVDGFGVLSSTAIFPVLTVLIMGLWMERARRQSIAELETESE
ncbi:DUF1538 domain-containing protein [Leptospira kemamanensis]|uniref:DUF1538 domain-containing protein n=1 Tax=Leptospira kemamanensis TaxID=2484942 RepID=A0A4R9JQX4_9LEPT|nr:DUF1538 domain-containing protein [Leptospira kemamanensis]TGL54534.1 DUF1538 domain-containing protein [Leptospira kemamanensis]